MIPEDIIQRIRDSVNIAELVREHVPSLKKSGRNFMARCPFHQERTPSFSVNLEMGLFKCFGCGAGGDAFKFVMLMEGLTYPEAIRKLASRLGIQIPERPMTVQESAASRERQAIYDLLEEAARYYHRLLLSSAEAAEARPYLIQRGLSAEIIEKFQLGFSPRSGQALLESAMRKGYRQELLGRAGLIRQSEGGRWHDSFWGRILFPIRDAQGRVIGFGGRVLESAQEAEGVPKYINSSENPVYSKGRHLFGLYEGAPMLRKTRQAILLEGYMDVLGCHQAGFETGVATLGTALTENHVRILSRYVDEGVLLFDADSAGAAAALRGGELLLEAGMRVRVMSLPEGMDPDEFLLHQGREAFGKRLSEALGFVEHVLATAIRETPPSTPEGKLAAANRVLPVIDRLKDPLLQDEYLKHVASILGVEKAILGKKLRLLRTGKKEDVELKSPRRFPTKEQEIVALVLRYPELHPRVIEKGLIWETSGARKLWEWAVRQWGIGGAFQVAEGLSLLSEEEQAVFQSLLVDGPQYKDPAVALDQMLKEWTRHHLAARLQVLEAEVVAMLDGRVAPDAQKLTEYKELQAQLKGSHL